MMKIASINPGVWGLLLTLVVLSGCASHGPQLQDEASSSDHEFEVSRLQEGRTGFVIRESGQLDSDLEDRFEAGVSALREKDYAAAVEAFTAVTEGAPNHSAAFINLAIAYIRSDRDAEAEKPLQRALELIPGHPLASHEYGLLLRRAGRFDEARSIYEDALDRFPEYFPLHKNLGVLCDLYMNDLACAAREYELFLEAQPKDEQVKLWLVEVQGRMAQ